MMKNWKKATAVLMAAVVAAGLAACGNDEQANAPTEETGVNLTGFPIVDEKITIKVMAPNWSNSRDFNEKSVIQEYEEKTNIHVEWTYFTGDASEKLSLAFAAKNNMPDCFLMADLPSSTVDKYGADGVILPVEDLIDKYAPNIKAAIEEDTDGKKMATAADGHMYAVPSLYRSPQEQIRGEQFINKQWLDKLGLSVPTTTDELYTVLKAFKEQDPNGNGEADEIPLVMEWDNNISGIASLFGSWGVSSAYTGAGGSCEAGPFFIKDGKVVVSNMQEEYKEAVKYFNKLYSEGLINVDTFTGESKNIEAKVKAEPYAVGMFSGWDCTKAGVFSKSSQYYTEVAPLKGPKGEQNVFKPVYGIFANNYISATSKHPMAVIRWMDGTADPDVSYEWNTGKVGKAIEKVDGKWKKIPVPEGEDESTYRGADVYQFPVMGITARWYKENVDLTNEPQAQFRIRVNDLYLPYASMMTVEHLRYTEEQRKTLEAVLPQIVDYSKQKEAEWVTNGNIDAEWEAHIKQLQNMNIDEVQKIMQEASDYWNSID